MSAKSHKKAAIPGVVVARLTRYLTCVQTLCPKKAGWISSQDIASALGVTGATVRRDLAKFSLGGITNRGYEAEPLYQNLIRLLGADTGWRIVVVGAGNLGKALAMHGNLQRMGFKVCGIFDADGRKFGKKVARYKVRPMTELASFIGRAKIDMGVIAVPAASAQAVADIMVAAGIRGLFNLSFTHVITPRHVGHVEGRLVAGMLELGHTLKHLPARVGTRGRRKKDHA